SDYSNSTILGVSQERLQPLVFSVKGEFAKATAFETFDVTPSGKVFVLATNVDHDSIVFEFDHSGDMKTHTKLDVPAAVILESLAVFDTSGNFLVWGYYSDRASGEMKGKRFVALMNPSGKVTRRLGNNK